MRVLIPSALHSYTGGPSVEAAGANLAGVLDELERRFPGIRFRMIDEQGRVRRYIRFFVAGEALTDLAAPLPADGELCIVQALSGG